MKQVTAEWVEKAEGDHRAAHLLARDPQPVYDAACFHAQQCAEKYLKAWLIERSVAFARVHDLEVLTRLCVPTLPEVATIIAPLRFLTTFAVEVRYPGTAATDKDTQACLATADQVRAMVRAGLGI